ncbi:hypothetical protein FEM48_Zijuj10G0176600 [Ziziphus jujuba var. spinosa]|uniref:Protein S-acyltransferase n=1 Tax=Ziziphus jujuba var. spinosa TaxID=714518 RepID=A0A978UPS9_ZIZJJ|nr:hypothetical protein FEM48_Zijuj10G0176600 [Ziziphus jujuba var. spinosa]
MLQLFLSVWALTSSTVSVQLKIKWSRCLAYSDLQNIVILQPSMFTTPLPPQLSDSNRRIIDTPGPSLRVYQVWKGSNRFCLKGRLIFGPDVRSLFLTVFLIVAPVILFCAFVSNRLIDDINHGELIVIICVVFTIYDILILLVTSGRDPGIIPRNEHPPEPEEVDGSTVSSDCPSSHNGAPSLPLTKDVVVNGIVVKVNNITDDEQCSLWRAFAKSPVSVILIVYTFIAAWFVGGLTTFHLYLICTNQTTYENFRYRYEGKMNPYNHGCARNVVEIFFSGIPKSKNNFRAMVKGDSSSVYNASTTLGHSMSPEMAKTSFDIEMGKRQAVAAEDFTDIHRQIDSVGGMERCGTQPRHTDWDSKANWEITPDIQILAAEFGMGYGVTDRQKIHGSL